MAIAYIGLGSNLGKREYYINKALEKISQAGIKILASSSIIETEPLGGMKQRKYLNGVIKVETDMSPYQLLTTLQKIENLLGRKRVYHWSPRTIDLDILLYDNLIICDSKLTIPHPGIGDRDFIQRGLLEISPGLKGKLKEINRGRNNEISEISR